MPGGRGSSVHRLVLLTSRKCTANILRLNEDGINNDYNNLLWSEITEEQDLDD